MGRDREDDLESYIESLLKIEADPRLGTLLKHFESQDHHLSAQMERQLTRKAELNTDIFNIVGFYSAYQGLVLTAVSQLKSETYSTCEIVHFPIILTGLAAFVSIAALWMKFADRQDLEETISDTMRDLRILQRSIAVLKRRGGIDRINQFEVFPLPRSKAVLIKKIVVVLATLTFSGIFILSYFGILCDWLVISKWKGGFGSTEAV